VISIKGVSLLVVAAYLVGVSVARTRRSLFSRRVLTSARVASDHTQCADVTVACDALGVSITSPALVSLGSARPVHSYEGGLVTDEGLTTLRV